MFEWDSFPALNTKNVDTSPRFPSVTYSASSEQRFRIYGILNNDDTVEICSGQTAAGKKPKLRPSLNWNSRTAEYQSVRQLSPLSDGSLFDSKWSVISELQLSEYGQFAEIGSSGLTGPFGHNWSLGEPSPWQPWKLWIPKLSLTNSAFWWLLTWSHPMHGSIVMSFQRQVTVLNGSGQTGPRSELSGLGA
jgi:hypothetical protein